MAVNFATNPKHSLLAWLLVILLSAAIAALTGIGERRRHVTATGQITTSTPDLVSAPVNSELVMRRTEHISPSGRKTITTDFYSMEIAMQSLGDDSFDEGQND